MAEVKAARPRRPVRRKMMERMVVVVVRGCEDGSVEGMEERRDTYRQ